MGTDTLGFNHHSPFRTTSHFVPTEGEQVVLDIKVEEAGRPLPRALFSSTQAGWQGEVVEIKSGQLRSWWHDIDDLLAAISNPQSGGKRDIGELERAMGTVEELCHELDRLVRSARSDGTTSVHPDRDPR